MLPRRSFSGHVEFGASLIVDALGDIVDFNYLTWSQLGKGFFDFQDVFCTAFCSLSE